MSTYVIHIVGVLLSWLIVVIGMLLLGYSNYRELSSENLLAFLYTALAYGISTYITKIDFKKRGK